MRRPLKKGAPHFHALDFLLEMQHHVCNQAFPQTSRLTACDASAVSALTELASGFRGGVWGGFLSLLVMVHESLSIVLGLLSPTMQGLLARLQSSRSFGCKVEVCLFDRVERFMETERVWKEQRLSLGASKGSA